MIFRIFGFIIESELRNSLPLSRIFVFKDLDELSSYDVRHFEG